MQNKGFPLSVVIAVAIAAALLAAFLFVDFGFRTEPDGKTDNTNLSASSRESVGQNPPPPPGGEQPSR